MNSPPTFTGERFLPDCTGEIAYEHLHRYAFAGVLAAGKRVLDAACGEGYGSALLARSAARVWGIDIDAATASHAQAAYAEPGRVGFVAGSCAALPLADASVDLVVSFETLEHLRESDQPRMLQEFARVLAPDGCLIISSPNRSLYSDARDYRNEFHLHELYRDGLERLLAPAFPSMRWFRQRLGFASGIWNESPASAVEAWQGDGTAISAYEGPDAMYFVVVAARTPSALPAEERRVSLFVDAGDRELARSEERAREALRLDRLLTVRDAALARQSAHVIHLEQLLEHHGRVVVERDADVARLQSLRAADEQELARRNDVAIGLRDRLEHVDGARAQLEEEGKRLTRSIEAQERIIEYRHSWRWWLELPPLRARRWWRSFRP